MDIALKVLPALLEGTKITMALFALTLFISAPLGILVGMGAVCRFKPVRFIIGIYTWIMRGTPLLLQIFFIFFGLPLINSEIVLNRFVAVLIAFVINYVAYFAEIYRGGIQAIDEGQYEGAKVLGLTKLQTFRKIILPQVTKVIMPSVGNEILTLIKDTSLVYAVGLGDVMRAGKIALQRESSIIPLVVVMVIYLILTGIATLFLKLLEKRFNYYK